MKKLIIHAGFPKSGTTALQAAFQENKEVLNLSQYVYPDSKQDAHHSAAASLVERSIGWNPAKRDSSRWVDFVNMIRESDAEKFLVSSEFLSSATLHQISQIRNDFKDFDTEVFFTIRPLTRIIPSIYQQNLKKGSVLTYPEWISRKFLYETGELRKVPKLINHGKILSLWVEVFGSNNISLVLADSKNPDKLYRNVESLLGIAELKPVETRALNRSLTLHECEILRRINLAVKDKWTWYEYAQFVRNGYVKEVTGTKNASCEGNLSTPQFLQEIVANFARSQINAINDLGIQVLGDLDMFSALDDDSDQRYSIDENQISKEFRIVIGNLNWERRKYRLQPLFWMKIFKSQLSWKTKKPAE
jgi:hypothetical protein